MSEALARPRVLASFAAVLLALSFAALAGWRPLDHDDLFFHLRGGEITLREHTIPMVETFSYTRPGERWITHEWGFGALVYLAYRIGGLQGLVALQSALVLLLAAATLWLVVARNGRRSVPLLAACCVVQFGLLTAWRYLSLRAMLPGSILLAFELVFLARLRATGERVWLLLLALLVIVWPNVHGGVVFGLGIVLLAALEAAATVWWGRRFGPFRFAGRHPLGLLGVLCIGVAEVAAGPNRFEVLLYPLQVNRFVYQSGFDLALGHFTPATPANSPLFYASLCLLLVGFLSTRRRHSSWSDVFCAAGFAVLAIRSNRFVLDYTVVAAPIIAGLVTPTVLRARIRPLPALAFAANAWLVTATWKSLDTRPLSPEFPESAAAFIEREAIVGKLFHPQNFGGYLGWRLGRPVFWDGRNVEFIGLTREIWREGFPTVADRYGVDVLLLRKPEWEPITQMLTPDRWALVYYDDDDAIFVRRLPSYASLIARRELRVFAPFGPAPDLEEIARDPRRLAEARGELDRALAVHPNTRRALFRKGILSFYEGDLARAQRELQQALDVGYDPNIAAVLGEVLARRLTASAGDR